MVKVERSITINARVEKVFAYIDDPVNGMKCLPSLTDVRDITGQGIGKRWKWTYKMMGLPLQGEAEVIEHIPNQRCVAKTTGGILSTWTWAFKAEAGGTRLNLVVEYTIPMPVLGKVAERLVLRLNEREFTLGMGNLKEILEG